LKSSLYFLLSYSSASFAVSRSESSPALTALAKTLAAGPPKDPSSQQELTTTISLLQAEITQAELVDARLRIQELEHELSQKEKTTYATIQENFMVRDQVQELTERLAMDGSGHGRRESNGHEVLKRKLEATTGERDKAQKLLGDIRKLIAGSPV
jgi:ATP-dependent Lon protease